MKRIVLSLLCMLLPFFEASASSIVNTKHDLSGNIQKQVCIFCHTPHNAGSTSAPLWNKPADLSAPFKFYTSGTMTIHVLPTRPNGPSLACLTCHTKKNSTVNAHVGLNGDVLPNDSCAKCHPNGGFSLPTARFSLGPDLSNDHPISIPYPIDGNEKFRPASDGTNGWQSQGVRLFNGYVECGSCHHPHNNEYPPFLAKSNSRSALCLVCHIK